MRTDNQKSRQDEGFAGTLKNIQLNDLIQMCCLSAVSLGIRVTKDQKHGTIFIKDGQIIHAEVENTKGEEAFYRILGWESGIFETIDVGHVDEVTIKKGYQFLLMEAAHQADERDSKKEKTSKSPAPPVRKLKVLVVDDSPMMSKILTSMINADDRIEVAGTAENGEKALTMLEELKPDLVTMDVNMPVMDGSTALKHIMIKSPCPVLIMSNVGEGSHKGIIDFLNLGAVDFMSKPVQNKYILIQQQKIVERILQAAGAQINNFKRIRTPKIVQKRDIAVGENGLCNSVIVISAGAGGHSVLLDLIARLPGNLKEPVLIFQTIPPALVKTVADYFNERSQVTIKPLVNKIVLQRGQCLFTTHGHHIYVEHAGKNTLLRVENRELTGNEPDGFDEFLVSLAAEFSDRMKVVLLSGSEIGTFEGLQSVKNNGGKVIIQKRSNCMVPAPLQRIVENKLFDMELDTEEIVKEVSQE